MKFKNNIKKCPLIPEPPITTKHNKMAAVNKAHLLSLQYYIYIYLYVLNLDSLELVIMTENTPLSLIFPFFPIHNHLLQSFLTISLLIHNHNLLLLLIQNRKSTLLLLLLLLQQKHLSTGYTGTHE